MVRHLISVGHTVVSLVRSSVSSNQNTKSLDSTAPHHLIIGDLNDEPVIPFNIDTIIHLAGQVILPGVVDDDFLVKNRTIAEGLIRLMRRLDVDRVVNFSTASIYGTVGNGSAIEDMSPHKPSAYGASKYASEVKLSLFSEGLSLTHVRTPGIIGRGANPNLITKLADYASAGGKIELAHLEANFNNVVHVMDVCKFLDHLLLTNPIAGSDSVNLSSSSPITIKEVGELILNFYGNRNPIQSRESSTPPFIIDVNKLKQIYNFECLPVNQTILRFLKEKQ